MIGWRAGRRPMARSSVLFCDDGGSADPAEECVSSAEYRRRLPAPHGRLFIRGVFLTCAAELPAAIGAVNDSDPGLAVARNHT